MLAILSFLQRRVLSIYWLILLVHCLLLAWHLPFTVVTKPMLMPLLLVYLLGRDNNIGRTPGKFIFYVGLFLALFGDVLLMYINDTFFLSGMIIFMIMNICYAVSFLQLTSFRIRQPLALVVTAFLLLLAGYQFYVFIQYDLGRLATPVIVYMLSIGLMILSAVNLTGDERFRQAAAQYFLPGALIFLAENILMAINNFRHHDRPETWLSVSVMAIYAVAQYLFVRGIERAYL